MLTVRQALDVSKRSVSYRDAEVLLGHVLAQPREWLLTHPDSTLHSTQEARYRSYLERREQNEPVAYITGIKEFYGRPFHCDKRALIPRPETEILIDRALTLLAETTPQPTYNLLDIGTGCGNIAVTLALELSKRQVPARLLATDISKDALSLAQANWKNLDNKETSQLTFVVANLFENVVLTKHAPYQLILANLPYVKDTWRTDPAAQADVVFYEPDLALFGGSDGLDLYRTFFAEVSAYLAPNASILVEYDADQTETMLSLISTHLPNASTHVYQDYAGLDRLLEITSKT